MRVLRLTRRVPSRTSAEEGATGGQGLGEGWGFKSMRMSEKVW
jgi:hypothetical protein